MKTFTTVRPVLFVFLPFLMLISLGNYSDDDPRVNRIINQFQLYRIKCGQQKVYLHTDKDVYMTGETIWIKGYLLDAATLYPDSVSKDVYVELLNAEKKAISQQILKNVRGYSYGDIIINDTLREGNYQLRAYTNWMRNFDSDYFFYKTISVKNPNYENIVTPARIKEIKRFNKTQKREDEHYFITFFPEGGNLIAGLPCKLAFKAETGLGNPLQVKGTVVDAKGKEFATIESIHDGMGYFTFTPERGVKYHAKVTFENGKTKKFLLPAALSKGVAMSVDASSQDDIKVSIESNRSVSANIAENEVIVVGQSRGVITYISKGEITGKPVKSIIPKKLFPPGVAQIILFAGRGEPVSERLVFIKPEKDQVNPVKLTTKSVDDSVFFNVSINSYGKWKGRSNLSLSVIENVPGQVSGNNENILTNLLLTSDLKGMIANPSYYFDRNNIDAGKHLDLIMLTHGWRRFVASDVIANKFPAMIYPKKGGLSISGRITRDLLRLPMPNNKVMLSVLKTYNDRFETKTDAKGFFEFPLSDYEDTIDIKLESFTPGGSKRGQIILEDTLTPGLMAKPYPFFYGEAYDKKKIKKNGKQEYRKFRENTKPLSDYDLYGGKIYGAPSNRLKVGNDASAYSNILQYMQGKVPGVTVEGNSVTIRGVNTILGSTEPLFLLNDIVISASAVPMLTPQDIDYIDILKGPEASIYGSRGANGVILFYTKHGSYIYRGVLDFSMLGYHKAREFYVPPYESWAYKPSDYKISRTIYWNPSVIPNSEGQAMLRFKKKFTVEKYTVIIEGIANDGEIISSVTNN